jgi:hypothetical protein
MVKQRNSHPRIARDVPDSPLPALSVDDRLRVAECTTVMHYFDEQHLGSNQVHTRSVWFANVSVNNAAVG